MIIVSLKLAVFLGLMIVVAAVGATWWATRQRLSRRATPSLSETAQLSMRAQQQFIGQLSHELRTPLTAMLAHASVARNPATDEQVRNTSLAILEKETSRLALLVRDLLELQRLETSSDVALLPLELVVVVEEVLLSLVGMAEAAQIVLRFDVANSLPLVLGQAERLKQVWLNVVSNAIKYGRAGDTVTIRLVQQHDGVKCVVEDTGPGIAPQHLPHVTERLFRGRNDVEGSGLGLALVQRILEHHGSELHLNSSVEAPTGTLVWWVLAYAA